MRVNVKLFARLRDVAGTGEMECEVPAGSTVADVWASLGQQFPSLSPYAASISCAVNAEYARMNAPVANGDEVAFLPPVSGGGAEIS